MRYLGGKSRIAKHLAAEIDKVRKPGQWVWEPFCGGLSMTVALSKNGPVWATDANAALIALYQAVRDGWDPPQASTREQRDAALDLPDCDPVKAFLRIGCGFAGNWSSGHAGAYPNGRSYAAEARSALRRDVPRVRAFDRADFLSIAPRPTDMVLYCDPPYAGTTGYAAVGAFDHAGFVRAVIGWSRFTDVWVSEYTFPVGRVVWSRQMAVRSAGGDGANARGGQATERLFYIAKGSLP